MIHKETWKCALCIWFLAIGFVQTKIVETTKGKLEGGERMSRDGRPYLYWTKIPYAKPPIGKLRLASPEPMDKWEGVMKATELPPMCLQKNVFLVNFPQVGQEDCLYLSVYAPKTDKKNLPVLLYFHGGCFVFSFPELQTTADYLMDEDVILVTFEYRLGVLGFMSLNDPELPGNFGMKDQALVLNWVYENIANFGGDPKKITLFGESAGGASANYLAVLPSTADKVAGVFMMSGSLTKVWSRIPTARVKRFSENVVGKMGCTKPTVNESLECLRNVEDSDMFISASSPFFDKPTEKINIGPTIEPPGPNALITDDMTNYKIAKTKPIVATITAGEYLLSEIPDIFNNYSRAAQISQDLDAFTELILQDIVTDDTHEEKSRKIKQRYLSSEDIPVLAHEVAILFEDMFMIYPTFDAVEKHEGAKWMYVLLHRGETSILEIVNNIPPMPQVSKEAFHSDEVKILFNVLGSYQYAKPTPDPDDVRVSREMVKYLTNFATHGNPTPEGSPFIWKPFQGNEVLLIKTEGNFYEDDAYIKKSKETMEFFKSLNFV